MQEGIKFVSSINLANTVHLTLVILWDQVPPNLLTQPESLLVAPPYKEHTLAHAVDFPKSLKGPQTQNKQWLASACLVAFVKRLQA